MSTEDQLKLLQKRQALNIYNTFHIILAVCFSSSTPDALKGATLTAALTSVKLLADEEAMSSNGGPNPINFWKGVLSELEIFKP